MGREPVELLPLLYGAPADPEQWGLFLDGLRRLMRAKVGTLIGRNERNEQLTLVVQSGADPDAQKLYQSHYFAIDPFFAYAQKRGFNVPGAIASSQAFVSDEELLKTEFCNDFMLKFDMFQECFALFGKNGIALANLSMIRRPQDQPFDEPELGVLRFLAPHVQQALQLTDRFQQLKMESQAKQKALDQMGLGVVFLAATGRVLGGNEAAARLLERQEGLTISKRRLKAEFPEEDRLLQKAIWQSCQTGAGRNGGTGTGLRISRRAPARPLQVVIGPACSGVSGLPTCPAAVVFIDDLSARIRPRHELLKALYGLTPAESRIALLLLDGKPREEIQAVLGITRNTLKTQIQSIFDKTDVRRQSQLIRLLMRLPVGSG